MTRLDCNVVTCAYNADNCCKREAINVRGEDASTSSQTACGSFSTSSAATNACRGDACKETEVSCEAVECMYNSGHQCRANHIGISGGRAEAGKDTECASFVCG